MTFTLWLGVASGSACSELNEVPLSTDRPAFAARSAWTADVVWVGAVCAPAAEADETSTAAIRILIIIGVERMATGFGLNQFDQVGQPMIQSAFHQLNNG
ncbi:hypothetical protein FHS31_002685 [Sphingomonas vulcanisoli]|uniref:Uncharacterized protein n=1 Tax=Sphingomonas vulcanisoli TaxID=1658060 RepID=A0ABX0TZ82_9SPHN|nr:hypothetical protein [Sphingomonas vulcanisoli]NIJ09055.1 hypothetical protein [Sphingomonas vulcanisoli]